MNDHHPDPAQYHRLTGNSLWAMASNFSMAFVLLLTVLASRVLGDDLFGQYVFLLAVATLLSDLSVLGTTDYASILVARRPERTGVIVANTVGLRIPFAALYLIAVGLVAWAKLPESLVAGLLIGVDWVIRTLIHLYRGVLRSRDVFGQDARVATVERFAVLVCGGAALLLDGSLVGFAAGFVIGRLIGLAACLSAYAGLGERAYVGFDTGLWRRILRGGVPIGARGMLKGVSFRVDAIMLGLLRSSAEVGWYGAAYKFLEAGFFFTEAVGSVIQPPIALAYSKGRKLVVGDLYGRGYKVLLVIGGFLAVIGLLYARPLVLFVFSEEYINAAAAVQVLVWAMLFVFASMTSLSVADGVDAGGRTVIPFAVAAVLNVALNAVLIPQIGYMGAAWSTLLTEFFLAVALLYITTRAGYTFPAAWVIGPLVGSLAFLAVGLLWPTWLGTLVGFIVFIAVLHFAGVFDAADRQYMRFLGDRARSARD